MRILSDYGMILILPFSNLRKIRHRKEVAVVKDVLVAFIVSILAGVITDCICVWINEHRKGR